MSYGAGTLLSPRTISSLLQNHIALNQRLHAELEGMAKLLYDYWFVQYDFPLSLAQLRDWLLPMLMDGQARVTS